MTKRKETRASKRLSPFALRARCVIFCLSTFSHILAPLCLFWKSDVPPAGKLALLGSTVLGPWLRFRNTLLSLFHPIINLARVYMWTTFGHPRFALSPAWWDAGGKLALSSRGRRMCLARACRCSLLKSPRETGVDGGAYAAFIYRRPRARYTRLVTFGRLRSTTERDNVGPGSLRGSSCLPSPDGEPGGTGEGTVRARLFRKRETRHPLCRCDVSATGTRDERAPRHVPSEGWKTPVASPL